MKNALKWVETRAIARLPTLDGQEMNISSYFLILLLFSFICPQFVLIFFLNLVLQEGPGYTTAWALLVQTSLVLVLEIILMDFEKNYVQFQFFTPKL